MDVLLQVPVSETLELARATGHVYKILFRIPKCSEQNNKSKVTAGQPAAGSNVLNTSRRSPTAKSIFNRSMTISGIKRPCEYQGKRRSSKIQKIAASGPGQPCIAPRITCSDFVPQAKINSKLTYALVMDFESTCWEKMPVMSTSVEIIEFPAVLMNLHTGEIEDQFQQYVMPVEQPTLSKFCTKLTGITQAQVESGIPLGPAVWRFSEWLDTVTIEKNLVPLGSSAEGAKYAVVTWSDWDLNICLPKECNRKGIQIPKVLRQWVDLRAVYKQWYGRPPRGLKGSMEDVGLIFEGAEHSGLTDSQNTARLALRLVSEGAELTISKAVK